MKTFNVWLEEMNKKDLNEARKHNTLNKKSKKKSKKKVAGDVTGDGKADFADVMTSRMVASGIPKNIAIFKSKKYKTKSK